MKTAVCMKYVPVIARMQFDYEARTIIREGVPSEVNPFDVLGLVRAVELKTEPQDEVVVLTMGPPTASEGLTSCLALGADRGVLITDRALAGSDTLATSRALALALQREAPDLIICGRNSTDGETGQVGPEVAELMGLPHVSHVRRLGLSDDRRTAVVERMTDEGFQTLECDLPAVICVTEGVAPELFPNRQQMEEAAEKPIDEVNCSMLSDDPSQFGAQGSPTWVNEIRLVEPNRLGVTLQEVSPEDAARQIAQSVRDRLAELESAEPESSGEPLPRYPASTERSIWVVAENRRDGLAHVTYELLGKARDLTTITHSEVVAVVISPNGESHASAMAAAGADRVLVIDNSSLGPVCGRAVGNVLAEAVRGGDPLRNTVRLHRRRPGLGRAAGGSAQSGLDRRRHRLGNRRRGTAGSAEARPRRECGRAHPFQDTAEPGHTAPGLLTPAVSDPGATATVQNLTAAPFEGADVRLVREEFQEDTAGLDLARARVVVGVGMGAGEENVARLLEVARSLGASVAATRDVVHEGWLPPQLQVGISGRTIAPTVYIAVGIRGAFNHTVGLQRAGIIVAINQNRRATIFRSSDFGVVGTWQEFLPPLIEELRPVLANLS